METLEVVLDPGVGVSAADLAYAWDGDHEARQAGLATVSSARPGDFFGVVELVVVPLSVNLATTAITVMVGRLIAKFRAGVAQQPELEFAEMTRASGDRIVVVRLRG